MLNFNLENHQYTWQGRPVLSVTQILKKSGLADLSHVTQHGLDRGTAAHKACDLDDDGKLDEDTVDPNIAGYLRAWRCFKDITGIRVIAKEQPLFSERYGFAGTFDRYVWLFGSQVLIDLKCNQAPAWVGLQLSAYRQLCEECMGTVTSQYCLTLHDDGTYKLRNHQDRFHEFLLALRKVKGLKGETND